MPPPDIILRGHASSVTAVTFIAAVSGYSRFLLTGDEQGFLKLWDIESEESILSISPPLDPLGRSPVISLVQKQHSRDVYVHHKAGLIRIVSLAHNRFASELRAWRISSDFRPSVEQNENIIKLSNSFCPMVVSHSNRILCASDDPDTIALLHDTRTALQVDAVFRFAKAKPQKPLGMLMSIETVKNSIDYLPATAFSSFAIPEISNSEFSFLAGFEDGSVTKWDMRNICAPLARLEVAKEPVLNLSTCPFGNVVIAGGGFRELFALGDTASSTLCKLETAVLRSVGVAKTCWRPDGRIIASAGWDGRVRIWNGRRKPGSLLKPLASLRWHSGSVQALSFSPDSAWLASGGSDRTVALWNIFQSTS